MNYFPERELSNLKKHPVFDLSMDLNTICQPLFSTTDITYFTHSIHFKDGAISTLTTCPAWTEHFFKEKYYNGLYVVQNNISSKTRYMLWSVLPPSQALNDSSQYFDIDNGITILEFEKECCHCYLFATRRDNIQIANFYLNNLDVLERFILYYKDRAKKIIELAIKNKIVTVNNLNLDDRNLVHHKITDEQKKVYLEKTPIQNYYVSLDNKTIALSRREMDCIKLIAQGKSSTETAALLSISFRTVEKHIENVKLKLDCHKKSELISKITNFKIYT